MVKKDYYMVQVDENLIWTPCKYRKVTCDELDSILDTYGKKVLALCSNGKIGAMTMWAYFKNQISGGCYGEMINAYSLLTNDNKSLVDREHEFRHVWNIYEELWKIRYFGSMENFYLERVKEAKEYFENYKNVE